MLPCVFSNRKKRKLTVSLALFLTVLPTVLKATPGLGRNVPGNGAVINTTGAHVSQRCPAGPGAAEEVAGCCLALETLIYAYVLLSLLDMTELRARVL